MSRVEQKRRNYEKLRKDPARWEREMLLQAERRKRYKEALKNNSEDEGVKTLTFKEAADYLKIDVSSLIMECIKGVAPRPNQVDRNGEPTYDAREIEQYRLTRKSENADNHNV
jgi:hypothetical protein